MEDLISNEDSQLVQNVKLVDKKIALDPSVPFAVSASFSIPVNDILIFAIFAYQ